MPPLFDRVGVNPAAGNWPSGVGAVFTDRKGGASEPPWNSFNLGSHVGDAPEAVQANRLAFSRALPAHPIFLQQVHGWDVARLNLQTPDGTEADACWTDEPGVACTVMVADCLPLLLSAADGHSVAAAHLGWRGLVGIDAYGVLEALCEHWPAVQGRADRRSTLVWLGPCIGPEAFEVGSEVRQAFLQADPAARVCFRPARTEGVRCAEPTGDERWLADLPALARRRLLALGFESFMGNDGSAQWCTVSQPERYFSHRRDTARLGSTGRMAAAIWRD